MAEFQPIWNENTLRGVIKQYDANPAGHPPKLKELISQHAQYYNIPFFEGDFSIVDALGDFGKGFFAGFTTYDAWEPSDNEYEAVFRNLGHLAGFAPGIISAPLGAAAKLTKSKALLNAAGFARKMNDKSIPMAAAKWSTNKAKKLVGPFFRQGGKAKNDTVNTISNFLVGDKAKNMMEGAFHLGVASGVSSWQGGIDQMMSSFLHGGLAGGVFRGIGEFVNIGGESANILARRLTGSLFMGLPETVRGATTPEQVYAYVMGAWFGGQEIPARQREARKFMGEYVKDAEAKDAAPALKEMFDPEIHPKFKNLPEDVQVEVKKLFEKEFKTKAQSESALLYFAQKEGIDLDKLDIDMTTPEGKQRKVVIDRLKKLELFETENLGKEGLNDTEIGEQLSPEITLGKRVDNIFRKYMDKVKNPILEELKVELPADQISKKNEIIKKINALLTPYLKENTGTALNESELFVKDLQTMLLRDYKYSIDSNKIAQLSGDIRQWISRRNNNEAQPTLTTDGKDVWELTSKNRKNRAGNPKVKYEPYKLIDLLHQNLTGRDEWGHIYLDHITIKNEKGVTKELDLTQFLKEPTKKDTYGGKNDYMNMITNTMKSLDAKDLSQSYYYFGGNGAKKRLLFTRHHPDLHKVKLSDIQSFFNSVNYDAIKSRFNKEFKVGGDYFDKAFKSNVLWALEMNGMKYSRDNMLKILSPEFILKSVDFNKRNQIWMTDSYPGEKEFFTNKDSNGYVSDLSENGNFKFSIFPDYFQDQPKEVRDKIKKDSAYLDAKSSRMEEHFDGGPVVRDDVLKRLNLDAGTWHDVTQNKAFVLSPHPERGALLGKLMFHSAGKAQSEQMRKDGVHFYFPKSAIKQMGVRDYNVNYELDPTHIRYNYGVKQTSDYIKPQTLKKQILASLVQELAFNPKIKDATTMSEVVEDMKKNLIDKRYYGEKESNDALEAYKEKLGTASDKELIKDLDKIDFEKVSIPKLLNALRKDGNQIFAKKFYDEILRGRKSDLQEELESGNITEEQYKSGVNEIEEYNSLSDRMMASASREAKKRNKPLNQTGIHHHHFMNKFRNKVLSSWVLRQVTKPKVDNSGVARIRPYDYGLQTDADNVNKRLIELDTNDQLFFLDSAYKKMRIKTDILGEKTLEDLWKIYEDKKTPTKTKAYIESVFRSGVMRVPMDSTSGLQVLNFAGFTGREGHGILMHSRAMRALGGADLDGDTAYFYMGGKGGFKKSWLDMFEAQKGEFYETGDRKPVIPPVQNKLSKTEGISIQRDSIYGNPFVVPDVYDKSPSYYKKKGFVRASSRKDAIEKYDAWLRGHVFKDLKDIPADQDIDPIWQSTRRNKILSNIKAGKLTGKTLKYFKPEAKDSHAVRLVRFIAEMSKQPTKPDLSNTRLSNAKAKKYEDVLTESYDVSKPAEKLEHDLLNSPEAAFSPNYRFNASHGSMGGRELLGGGAVMPKQILGNAYEIISSKGSETIRTTDMYDNVYEFTLTPKTSEVAKREIAKLTRAAVGISADSSNYSGYKSFDTWYRKMLNAHFTIDYSKNGKKMSREALETYVDKVGTAVFRYNGTIGKLNDANRAFYGKDYTNNKQWTMEERRNLSNELASMSEEEMTTIMPKISKLLNSVDYSDNVLNKINRQKLTDLFDIYNDARGSYDYLKKPLSRGTFAILTGKYINKTLEHKLTNPDKLVEIADIDNPESNIKFWDIIKETPYEYVKRKGVKRGGLYQRKIQKEKDLAQYPTTESRIRVLNNIKESAADFLLKDIENLVSVARIHNRAQLLKAQFPDMSNKALNNILADAHQFSEWLKVNSYLMRDSRNQGDRDIELSKNRYIKTKGTAELDQNDIDIQIRKWKKNKSILEKELLDEFMLGSLNRAALKRMEELKAESVKRKLTNKESLELDRLRENAARTSSSRLGYSSEALEKRPDGTPKVMDEFIGDVNDVLSETLKQRAPEDIRIERKILVDEPQKPENVIKGLPEKLERQVEDIIYVDTTGWEGAKKFKKGEVDPETKKYIDNVVHILKVEPEVSKHFGFLVRKLLHKDINLMNHQDWRVMSEWLTDAKNGTIWQRLKKGELFTKLSQRHYMLMPETVNRELMRDEIKIMQEDGYFLTSEGMRMGKVAKPTQFVDYVQDGIRVTGEAATGLGDEIASDLSKKLMFLDTLTDGSDLHQVAVAKRNFSEVTRIMAQEGEQNMKWGKAQTYHKLLDKVMKTSDYENSLKNKEYNITITDSKGVSKRDAISGKEIVEKINEIYDNYFTEMHRFATGNVKTDSKGNTLKYKVKDSDKEEVHVIPDSIMEGIEGFTSGPKGSGYMIKSREFPTGFYDPLTRQNPVIDIKKFTNDLRKAWVKGNPIPREFGIDGMNKIVRSMIIEMASKSKEFTNKDLKKMQTTFAPPTGKIPNYWPHMHLNKSVALKSLDKYVKSLRLSELSDKEASETLTKLTYRHHALTGDWNFQDIDNMQELNGILHGISDAKTKQERKIKWLNNLNKPGSTQARDVHIPGFSLDREVPISYGKGFVNSYFRQMAQVFSRDGINRFEESMFKRNVEPEQRKAWTNWLKLYVQGAIGNPDVIPENILNDPTMKIKGTPYAWFADNMVRDRINKIGDKLGILNKNIPENLRGLDFNDLKWWSNLEAKFELASLLAHPKSVVNNIFGGTMHTIQSIGFRNWKNARSNKYMASLHPELGTKEGRDNFAVRQGIYPEQMIEEYGLNTAYQSTKNKQFIKDVAKSLIRDPSLSSESVLDMAKRAGIKGEEKVTQFASKFMSVPERALRRDAFMSHLLFWYNKFGGAIKDFEHPVLIELAKKGVKATQFLYSAPFRPMFSRTALGKVMTRFQTWGWNAVRFRNDALREAKIYGFKGAEGEKAARMMQMDLFVFALANAFAYSLFEVAMPSPWNWIQDTADWIFGDEKARNRAFMGTWPRALAPLQITTPPILRLPMSSMRAILEDDWSRVADYYIHTMYPFGRIGRDFIGPNNLIDNPMSIIDKWTGLPFIQMNKLSKERRKREEEGEEMYIPTPGAGLF